MKFKRQSRTGVDLNLTPLIDVVFLLLIFFMVTTTFTKENNLQLVLPEASSDAALPDSDFIRIAIARDGTFSVNQITLVSRDIESLKRAITTALGERQSQAVVLSADAKTPHESVVMAMDAAGQLGLVQVRIATQHTKDTQ